MEARRRRADCGQRDALRHRHIGGKEYGTVFSLTPEGNERTRYEFKGGSRDGEYPQTNLTYADGFLYGTTYQGGSASDGTAFKLSLKGKEQFVYSSKATAMVRIQNLGCCEGHTVWDRVAWRFWDAAWDDLQAYDVRAIDGAA